MTKEQLDIEALGPLGIIREALKLLWTHPKFFMLVQLILVLPVMLLSVHSEFEYRFFWSLLENNRPPHGIMRLPHPPSYFTVAFYGDGGAFGFHKGSIFGALLVGSAVVAICFEAAGSLASSAVLYAVGVHYRGHSVISFLDVLRVVVPRLWMRLTVTDIYYVFLLHSLTVVQAMFSLLLFESHGALRLVLLGLMFLVGVFCLDIIFMVATSVSVLEEDYGWAAVSRSLQLLKGRAMVAVLFQLLWVVVIAITVGMERGFRYRFSTGVYILWTSLVWEMKALCAGVQYMSFKGYHDDGLAEPILVKETTANEGGYERFGG